MPYKDPEQRRQFQREYKRRWRAAQAKNSPFKRVKIYLCQRYPFLHVGLTCFDDGFLITTRPDVIAQIQRHPIYGQFIFPLALDLSVNMEDEE